jgi:hypothetical protein
MGTPGRFLAQGVSQLNAANVIRLQPWIKAGAEILIWSDLERFGARLCEPPHFELQAAFEGSGILLV